MTLPRLAPPALAALALLLAGCSASPPQLYPHVVIGAPEAMTPTPPALAAFRRRRITRPAPRKLAGLAEAYVAALAPNPTQLAFTGIFLSAGRHPAICGFTAFASPDQARGAWRPFTVDWTEVPPGGSSAEGTDLLLGRRCGAMAPP